MGAELSHQDREMRRGRPEMGAAYMHTKKAGAGETRQIRKGSVFISKHISPLIEWPPPTTTAKPRCWNQAEIQGLILPRPCGAQKHDSVGSVLSFRVVLSSSVPRACQELLADAGTTQLVGTTHL